jgi:hypothetical protein
MPYLRVYLPEALSEQKHFIGQKLIDITLRTFHLRPEERYQISIEFISLRAANNLGPATPPGADFMLEVVGHDLTEGKKRAFVEEASALLTPLLPLKSKSRVARLLGIKPNVSRQVAFEFGELSPAISEPFVVHPGSEAA